MTRYSGSKTTGIALAAFSLTATLLLTGCGNNEADVAASGTGTPTASAAPDAIVTASGVPSVRPSETTAPSSPPPPSETTAPGETTQPSHDEQEPAADSIAVADCVLGNWYLDNEGFARALTFDEIPPEDSVTGVLMMTFHDDGTVETLYENWSFTYSGSGTGTVTRDGTDYGTVSLEDTVIDSTTLITENVGGVERTMEDDSGSQFSSTTFTCSDEELNPNSFVDYWALHREH